MGNCADGGRSLGTHAYCLHQYFSSAEASTYTAERCSTSRTRWSSYSPQVAGERAWRKSLGLPLYCVHPIQTLGLTKARSAPSTDIGLRALRLIHALRHLNWALPLTRHRESRCRSIAKFSRNHLKGRFWLDCQPCRPGIGKHPGFDGFYPARAVPVDNVQYLGVVEPCLPSWDIEAKTYSGPNTAGEVGNLVRRHVQLVPSIDEFPQIFPHGFQRGVPLPDVLQQLVG